MNKGLKKRQLAVALSACMMATSSLVYALGMGEIEVNTALNEPLGAKIKLFSATPDELKNLKVEMASQDAFARMGIDRLPLLRDIEFDLVGAGAGAPYIKVTSSKAIKEPFLDFILTVNWASGQMMREYTLLLDPPVFEKDQQLDRISAATAQPTQVSGAAPAAVASVQPGAAPAGSYGPTTRNDTLWTVARDMRPDRTISVPQMMIGLLKENPGAFAGQNINNLKAGYILRSPEMDVITQLSKQEAAAESNRQYQDWLASRGKTSAAANRQQRVSAPATISESAAKSAPLVVNKIPTESRLQLLTPDEEARIRAGTGTGGSGESAEALQRELALAIEASEASRQENSDLRSRLDELEEQLQSVQKLLTLKDDTLGAIQADANGEGEQTVVSPEAAKQAGESVDTVPAKNPAKLTSQPKEVVTSLLDEVLANPMYLAASGGVIALLLAVVIMRRRRAAEDEDFAVMAPSAGSVNSKSETADRDDAMTVSAAPDEDAAAAKENEAEGLIGDFGSGLGAIHAEESEIDPVAEADVYLAYRRYEQAEALLKEAIAADANRHELKLKLLEIYHTTKDVDSFEAQAESLYAALGGQEDVLWSRAVEMGRELLPDHPLFADGKVQVAPESTDNDMNFATSETTDDEFSFDDEQPMADDADAISDDELAKSLAFSTSGETAADAVTDTLAEIDASDVELGDLELDLVSDEEFDLSESVASDTHNLGSVDINTIDEADELVEDFDEFGTGSPADTDNTFEAGTDSDTELPNGYDTGAELEDMDKFSTGASATWDVEAAQSTFQSRDVESESDGLLDSARKKDEPSNVIDMDLSVHTDDVEDVQEQEDTEVQQLSMTNEESTESGTSGADSRGKTEFDSQAEITNLGEMDFSRMSDEDNSNDDIFEGSDDVVGTKLDLAKAYIDMGDQDGARSILDEVVEEGDDDQRQEAEQLKQQIS